jgi:uncharacterized membrane protein YpjA
MGGKKPGVVFLLVVIANLIGAYFGFFVYYKEQISSTPLSLLAFVADCPLAVLLFAAALVLFWAGVRNGFFTFLAAAYALKYGIWTVFVILYFNQVFLVPGYWPLYAVMMVTHAAMACEAFSLVGRVKVELWHLGVVLGWLLLNDYMDYFWGMKPWTVPESWILLPFTVGLTLVCVPALYYAYREGKPKAFVNVLFWK